MGTPARRTVSALARPRSWGGWCQGLSNQEIADELYLSINSVKTYIRSAYRKIDAVSRAQAVAWGIQHGFPAAVEKVSELE